MYIFDICIIFIFLGGWFIWKFIIEYLKNDLICVFFVVIFVLLFLVESEVRKIMLNIVKIVWESIMSVELNDILGRLYYILV